MQPTTRAPAVVSIPWLGDGLTLSAPETVHLAITARCNLACPGCYVPPFIGAELTTAELRNLIDQWTQMRVFQLAVGGGETLLRQDLFDVLAYAREQGIVPNLTTNGTLLTSDAVRRLERTGVARVNLSWCGPGAREQSHAVVRALRLLLGSTLRVGVNLLVTWALLPRLPQKLARLQALGVRQVTILRPKPPAIPSQVGAAWYAANRLCRADLLRLRDVLNAWQGILHLEVDSALVGLMGDTDAAALRWRGIYGCTAGQRICTVWPDGRVTPCSFLADMSDGSVHQTPFAELWRRGKGWEALRDTTAQPPCSAAARAAWPATNAATRSPETASAYTAGGKRDAHPERSRWLRHGSQHGGLPLHCPRQGHCLVCLLGWPAGRLRRRPGAGPDAVLS
ncbi:MAG: radical SAM protein [Chloroflexota bacterium]|nr:radical SAM protein [Chloroflexota bacterium]